MSNTVQHTATSHTSLTRHRRDTGAARGDRSPGGRPFGWFTRGARRLDHWLRGPRDRLARPRACLGDAGPGGELGVVAAVAGALDPQESVGSTCAGVDFRTC